MTRTLLALAAAVAFTFAVAAPMGSTAEAHKMRYKNKMCMANNLKGSTTKFKCKISEVCCYDVLLDQGKCLPKGQQCI